MISDRIGQPRQREMIGQEDELRPQNAGENAIGGRAQ